MIRTIARRSFAAAAWAYVAAIGLQVFFAGMYVFGGPKNLVLHTTFAHVFLLLTLALLVSAYLGRVPGADKRRFWIVFGLLVDIIEKSYPEIVPTSMLPSMPDYSLFDTAESSAQSLISATQAAYRHQWD